MSVRSRAAAGAASLVLAAPMLGGCGGPGEEPGPEPSASPAPSTPSEPSESPTASRTPAERSLTLAFIGDVHFERQLADLLEDPGTTLGPMTRHLRAADLAMANLESALVTGGELRPTSKELEEPSERYWFRSPPAALELLARSGVDVVTVANNHGADYGAAGLRQTLAAAADAPVAVVGAGRDAEEAFTPHRVTVRGTEVAVLAADASFRESDDPVWSAGEGGPGIAAAHDDPPERLVAAVEEASDSADVVVVYLHWGRAQQECPTGRQQRLARQLAEAGADVLVGSHAHVLLGAGMLGDTYVSYGLADFLWYHGARPQTGVLQVEITDGEVVGHRLQPARIPPGGGRPRQVLGDARAAARAQWNGLRGCAGLEPVGERERLPAFESQVREIGPALRRRMDASHDPDRCPVPLADLRHLTVSFVGFDGRARSGELVVHADHAADVVRVFEELYHARFPIRRMRLVDEYDGDDDRSMAADNTSAYNCRRVAGQDTWSAHAYGAAVDLNPVENPYLVGDDVRPPAGRQFAQVDRSPGADAEPGVIVEGGVVTEAFARIGWSWGGVWADPDYQHFTAR